MLALVLADQATKLAAFEHLGGGGRRLPLVGETLALWTSCNPGAAFGRFGEFPHLLVGGRVLAVGVLIWLVARAGSRPRLPLVGMGLVLAGALGNLVDNLATGCEVSGHPYRGVRDFLDVWYRPLLGIDEHFPAFNLADVCISVGAVLWILAGFGGSGAGSDEPAPGTGEVAG